MPGGKSLIALETIMDRAAARARSWTGRRRELVVDEKSAGQFASNADIEIETLLRQEIMAAFGRAAILGEELGGTLDERATGWALDPIDGTSNFLLGLPLWGISAGYLEEGKPVLGAIALPELGLLVSAAPGSGLRINREQRRGPSLLSSVRLMALGENDFEPGTDTDARAQVFRAEGYAVVRYRCAVFSLASAALGRLGGYIERGCGLWDIAAADIICREAGMMVSTEEVAPGRWEIDARWP